MRTSKHPLVQHSDTTPSFLRYTRCYGGFLWWLSWFK